MRCGGRQSPIHRVAEKANLYFGQMPVPMGPTGLSIIDAKDLTLLGCVLL